MGRFRVVDLSIGLGAVGAIVGAAAYLSPGEALAQGLCGANAGPLCKETKQCAQFDAKGNCVWWTYSYTYYPKT